MIKVKRTAAPQALQKQATRWLTELQAALDELAQIEKNPQATEQAKNRVKKAQQKYNHAEIKNALVEMFHGKCAYCESEVTAAAYGQIEHFYPKAIYPEKTFEWENLLLSCEICNNGQHKGVKFPLDAEAILY